MFFVVAVNHTLEKCAWFIAQGTGIDVNYEENRKYKSYHDVERVIEQESADTKKIRGNPLREHQQNT